MSETNPNGANGTTADPREQVMWNIYITKLTAGIENAYAAAIEAGYSEDHSRNITLQGWFKERKAKLKRKDMLSKAEKVLDKTLDMDAVDQEGKVDAAVLRIQTDVAKHITNTLGKDEGYSTKSQTDLTSNGQPIFQIAQSIADKNGINTKADVQNN